MPLRCFVVCAFGHEDRSAEDRRLLDELAGLYQHIFRRAEAFCRDAGVHVDIVDGRADDGRHILGITQQGIDSADAVIVVLTANNPNVFVELGWAHAMWHDPILLMRDGYHLPVDINNLLCITFKTAQIEGRDEAGAVRTAKLLADKVRERIAGRRQLKPFDHWPETTLARGGVKVYNRFSRGITVADWSAMLQDAEREIIVASSGMSRIYDQRMFWTDPSKGETAIPFGQFLLRKALQGVAVTVLMYHEDNVTPHHLKEDETDPDPLRDEVGRAFIRWSTLRQTFETARQTEESRGGPQDGASGGAFRVVQLQQRYLPYRITFTEKRVLLTLRFYTEMFNSGLCIDAIAPTGPVDPNNMPVHAQVRKELQHLIEPNLGSSEERYRAWDSAKRA